MTIDVRLADIKRAYEKGPHRIGEVATAEQISEFEARHALSLPLEYRLFLTHVGNGGDGPPDYGMFPFQECRHDELRKVRYNYDPNRPFPLTESWIWEGEECDESDEEEIDRVHGFGHIYLGTDGCGMQHALITSGAEQGNVWLITGEGASPFQFDEDRRYSFLDWIEAWLDGKEPFSAKG